MRKLFIVGLSLLIACSAFADDADDAGAKLYDYFAAFTEKDIDKIVTSVYSTPVHIGGGSGHSIMADPAGAKASLTSLYERIEAQGWVESRILDLKICVASDSLALVDTRYSRIDQDGEAIPPAIRTTLYVLQKLEGGWRIVSFYSHDNDKRPHCD